MATTNQARKVRPSTIWMTDSNGNHAQFCDTHAVKSSLRHSDFLEAHTTNGWIASEVALVGGGGPCAECVRQSA